MGYNTSIIVLNDYLHDIAKDDQFGKKIADAILGLTYKSDGYISPGAKVIETHHADDTTLVAFGGNFATKLDVQVGSSHHDPVFQFKLLETWANKMGYKLTKKRKPYART